MNRGGSLEVQIATRLGDMNLRAGLPKRVSIGGGTYTTKGQRPHLAKNEQPDSCKILKRCGYNHAILGRGEDHELLHGDQAL